MKNPILKTYQYLDDAIMSGVNKGVRAWNWTTGRTKADLANGLHVASLPFLLYSSFNVSPVFGSLASLLTLTTPLIMKRHKQLENLEYRAAEKSLKDPEVEGFKERCKTSALFMTPLSIIAMVDGTKKGLTIGTYLVLSTLSDQVMRAEYLPPRKSVVARAADKIGEYLRESVRIPLPARAYVGSGNYRLSLEEATAELELKHFQ